jgi:hypothetical protein
MADELTVPVQTVRASGQDHYLEPDAMRGSEQFLRNIVDADGNAITPVDEEEPRRQFQANAIQSRAPIRVVTSQSDTPASEYLPEPVPVSETPPSSPNVMRAPMVAAGVDRTAPVQPDPSVDWQARARAEGWAPASENRSLGERDMSTQGTPATPGWAGPSTTSPVPNAEPEQQAFETAPPPAPASAEGSSRTDA